MVVVGGVGERQEEGREGEGEVGDEERFLILRGEISLFFVCFWNMYFMIFAYLFCGLYSVVILISFLGSVIVIIWTSFTLR